MTPGPVVASPVTKVVLADQDAMALRALIRLCAESAIPVVGSSTQLETVIPLLGSLNADALVLGVDPYLPAGIALAIRVARVYPACRIVLMSNVLDNFPTHARNLGAEYLHKGASVEEIVAVIRGISGDTVLATHPPRVNPEAALSPTEFLAARRVADGETNQIIATALNVSVNTVKTHVSRSLKKLQLDNRVQLAVYIRQTEAYTAAETARADSARP